MAQKLLITGGCGFVGANLIAQLVEDGGYDIRVLDNETEGKSDWIAEFDTEFIHGDITSKEDVKKAIDGVDAVVHLAAHTSVIDSISHPDVDFNSNVVGTMNILQSMREAGIKRFINASTGGAILGEAEPPVHEEMVPRPLSPYGAAKLAVEGYCSAFSGSYGFAATSLRFSNVYGPRSYHKGSVVAHFFKCILNSEPLVVYGDGSQTRDYVHSRDLSSGIISAIKAEKAGVFQLGTGVPTSLNELITIMQEVAGPKYNFNVEYRDFRAGEILHNYCNIDHAKKEIGYTTPTELTEGLAETWQWFSDNRELFEK